MLDAFKLKPFDLEPIYASWTDGPRFTGNPKKDPPVDEWLKQVKAGCQQRNVPKEYWHKVGQHFMGDKARARLDELKRVMCKVHGGKYRWNWEKYKTAMRNMGWNIEETATETVKVHSKRSGLWWITRKDEEVTEPTVITDEPEEMEESLPTPPAKPKRSQTMPLGALTGKIRMNGKEKSEPAPPQASSSSSSPSFFWNKSMDDSKRPTPQKSRSDSLVLASKDEQTSVTVAHAPLWLVNACTALDFLQSEHPKVMSGIAAVLITVGTIPAIPAISAGAGGAILASSAAQAVGAIAMGVGTWMKSQADLRNGNGNSSSSNSNGH